MKISYVVLYVKDTTKCMEFWVNKMEYEKKEETQIGEEIIYKVGKSGDYTNFELVPLKLMEDNPHNLNLGIPSIAFEVENLEQENEKLKLKEVKVTDISNHGGILSFTFFDNEENAYAIVQENKNN